MIRYNFWDKLFSGKLFFGMRYLALLAAFLLISSFTLVACATLEESAEVDPAEPVEQVEEEVPEEEVRNETMVDNGTEAEMEKETVDQKLILNGAIELAVADAEETRLTIRDYVNELGGYVENSNFRSVNEKERQGHMTVRIPQEKFDESMDYFEEFGDVLSRSTSSEDVTMEYVDMEARLNNLERQEERYLDILDEAANVEEIMEVEARLREVREEIEAMTARLESLEDQVSFATIDIRISEERPVEAQVDAEGFEGLLNRMASAFTRSINTLINGLTNLAVFLSGAFPYLVIFAAIGGGAYKIRGSLKAKMKKEGRSGPDEF